jgi:putative ABC transport system substrate-binding protein
MMRTAGNAKAIESAIAGFKRDNADALLVMPDSEVLERNLRVVTTLAAQHRLPAIYPWRTYVDLADGLVSYGPNLPSLNRRAAYFVDRILKGTKAGDLPVELPKEFELVVNLKPARALGLAISQRLQLQANEVIQ